MDFIIIEGDSRLVEEVKRTLRGLELMDCSSGNHRWLKINLCNQDHWWVREDKASSFKRYSLPQQQQTVCTLLGIPLPTPAFKIGDAVRVVRDKDNRTGGSAKKETEGYIVRKADVRDWSVYTNLDEHEGYIGLFNNHELQLRETTQETPMQQEFKIGDKARVLDGATKRIGKIGVVSDMTTSRFSIQLTIDDEDISWFEPDQLQLVEEAKAEKDVYYLSGTPGQLEGFRKDWKAAGLAEPETSIYAFREGNSIYITLKGKNNKPELWWNTDTSAKAVPVTTIWTEVIAHGVKHEQQTSKAPIKLAGYEVELKEEVLHIGCKRVPKAKALELLQSVQELSEILDGHQVTYKELLKVREWLLTK